MTDKIVNSVVYGAKDRNIYKGGSFQFARNDDPSRNKTSQGQSADIFRPNEVIPDLQRSQGGCFRRCGPDGQLLRLKGGGPPADDGLLKEYRGHP